MQEKDAQVFPMHVMAWFYFLASLIKTLLVKTASASYYLKLSLSMLLIDMFLIFKNAYLIVFGNLKNFEKLKG